MQDPKKPPVGPSGSSPFPPANDELDLSSTVDDFFARLHPDMRRPLPTQDAIAAALQTMQRLAAEAAADAGADSSSRARATASCEACGHQNRPGNQFCGKCGRPLALSTAPPPGDDPSPSPSAFQTRKHCPAGNITTIIIITITTSHLARKPPRDLLLARLRAVPPIPG